MRNIGIIILVIGSLFGLVFIQYHLLKVGILLEKRQFDLKIKNVLEEVSQQVDDNVVIRRNLARMYNTSVEELRSPEYLLPKMLKDSLDYLFEQELQRANLQLQYTYQMLELHTEQILVPTEAKTNLPSNSEIFKKRLWGRVASECRCQPLLELRVDHVLNYLFRQLAYLIVPSVLFILLLLACLFLLLNNLSRQRKLGKIKNDFINNLTHELKTPVFSISLMNKILTEAVKSGKKEKALEFIQLIDKENEQLKKHIEKVLELASWENGRLQLQFQMMDIHQLLQELVGQFSVKVQQQGGQLRAEFKAVKSQLNVDPDHFRNAVQNVLENALKYNDKTPDILLQTSNEARFLVLKIADNGVGIQAEDQKQIFEKFYRVSQGDVHQVKGFGLGLSYVKQIIEAHGGEVSVKSKPQKGTEFFIKIPIHDSPVSF